MKAADEHIHWAANMSTVFEALPLLERPEAARKAGFDLVESWWPFDGPTPTSTDVDAFCASVEAAGVGLVAMNLFGGTHGLRGILSHPGHTEAFRLSIDSAVAVAKRLGTALFNAPYGAALAGLTTQEQDLVASANLAFAGEAVCHVGGTILLEPLSSPNASVERFPIDSLERAASVASVAGADNIGLLFDQYHLEVNGFDLATELWNWRDQIAHVQIADAPHRSEPGSGETDFAGFFGQLRAVGYSGAVALEFFASPTSDDPLRIWRERHERWAADDS